MPVNITFSVGEGEERISIDAERFNSNSSFGWQILVFFEVVQTTGTILEKKTKTPSVKTHAIIT